MSRPRPVPELVDIACQIRRKTEKAVAIADGTMEEVVDPKTGEVTERERFYWLPLSQIEINEDGTITMPIWMAEVKGLV